jgi:hypothetical protein
MNFKCKITEADITYGSWNPDDVEAFVTAGELMSKGYRKTSNAYCIVSRVDREDWLEVMARQRNCSVADFYNVDGTGVRDSHRDHYIRVFSEDNLTVSPKVLRLMKGY